ncbi:hypothetical protein [Kaistia sp. UC242_56]
MKLVKPGVDVEFVDQTPTASVAPAPAPVPVAVEAGGEQAMPPPLQ